MKKIFVIFVAILCLSVILIGKHHYDSNLANTNHRALAYQAEVDKKTGEINSIKKSIYNDIPGIVVWGDSLTQGAGGNGTTYPDVLHQLITKNIFDIPVINMGVGGENTQTIMARAGSQNFVTDSFTIPDDTSKVKINIKSSNGNQVAPLRQGDGGINPVTIDGVKGTISIEQDSVSSKNFAYNFQRLGTGISKEARDGTVVKIDSQSKFENYVPVVFMGQNGGYASPDDLIKQIHSILNLSKSNKKYLVLGLTSGNAVNRSELEKAMENEFGKKYLNLREFISKNGIKLAGLKPSSADKQAMSEGAVPPSLLSDQVHFKSYGYEIIGKAVYERMNKLGYFNGILKSAEKINALQ
ncbi:SGNH/GDSL hydrolase family protein [Sporolactobacillus kofuensis]|uniref:SGNH/GDSL hydrolase family protein n=1 Tax=Sporolactobacillus kofuensis TaxID=269672 RepID=A0ABW1WAA6_9BACL|nr:SGNH/GDSL hydrolase family protein [Sporolactobacillus kofuensis]MCO7175565.1 hypothetical protein [Sporolactobacillus kofuensis]